jgi:hypothetical protein
VASQELVGLEVVRLSPHSSRRFLHVRFSVIWHRVPQYSARVLEDHELLNVIEVFNQILVQLSFHFKNSGFVVVECIVGQHALVLESESSCSLEFKRFSGIPAHFAS